MADIPGATATLRERLLGKIVNAGPATPCATWVGGYNRDGRRTKPVKYARPVIQLGARGTPMVYVAPTLLRLAGEKPTRQRREAGHKCPTGTPWNGVYCCVDLDHLRWVSRRQNEADKYL